MHLTTEQLKKLTKIAEKAAISAGKMIAAVVKKDPGLSNLTIDEKQTGSSRASQVVTEVDLASEKIILDELSPTLEKYDLALLSEETIDDRSRFEKDYFWCIDPLDGTLAFTQGRSGFSVSIALVSQQGTAVIGVIYDPSSLILYSCTKGLGVKKNALDFELAQPVSLATNNTLTIITEPSLSQHPDFQNILVGLKCSESQPHWNAIKLLEGGGAVINACDVLGNHPAVYFKLPKLAEGGGSSWDFAATSAIYNELGLAVTDIYGYPLQLNKKGNTFMNHCGVLYASDKLVAETMAEIIRNTLRKVDS